MRIPFYRLVNSAHFLANSRWCDGSLLALLDLDEFHKKGFQEKLRLGESRQYRESGQKWAYVNLPPRL